MFWKSILAELSSAKPRRRTRRRLGVEILEDRLAPATLSRNGININIQLDFTNEALQIASSGATLALTSTNTFSDGGLGGSFTGYGTTSGTLNPGSFFAINISDIQSGTSVTFQDSGANAYTKAIDVSLFNSPGNINFNGTSTFTNFFNAKTSVGAINVSAGAVLNLGGTSSTFQTGTGGSVHLLGKLVVTGAALNVKTPNDIADTSVTAIQTSATTLSTFTISGGTHDILLQQGRNDFAGPVTFAQSTGTVRDVGLRNLNPSAALPNITGLAIRNYTLIFDNTRIVLPAGFNVTGDLNVSAGSGIRESGAISAGGNANFAITSNGSITLNTSPDNTIAGSISFDTTRCDNTTTVAYDGAGAVILGATNLGLGRFTIFARGNITQSGAIKQKRGGSQVLFSQANVGATVTLDNPSNDIEGSLVIASFGTAVSLTNSSTLAVFPAFGGGPITNLTLNFPSAPVVLPNLNLTTLTVTADGIYQSAGTALHVSGNADFNANDNPLVLENGNNNFANVRLRNSGPNRIIINDVNSLNFAVGDTVLGSGPLIVTAGGAITQSANTITQAANAGRATFTAGPGFAITLNLNQNNTFTGPVVFNTSGTTGDVTLVNSSTPLILGTSNIGGSFSIFNRSQSPISQDPNSTLTVGHETVINGGGAAVALDNLGNHFLGGITVIGATNASFRNSDALVLNGGSITGNLTVHAGGTISESSSISAAGDVLLDAGTGSISLNFGNNFNSLSLISTGSAPVTVNTSFSTLRVDRIQLGSGALSLTAFAITQDPSAGGITQTAAATLTFNVVAAVSLQATANRFLGAVNLPNGVQGLTLVNQKDIAFVGAPSITGAVDLTAGGVLTLPNEPLTLSTFKAAANNTIVRKDITVGANVTSAMQFEGAVSLGANVTLSTNSTVLGQISFAGDVNPAGPLTIQLGSSGQLNLNGGTWSQGEFGLLLNGGAAFNIGNGLALATFSMVSGFINAVGSIDVVVNAAGTFKVGGTSNAETVIVDNNAGDITFKDGSTLSVGLGAAVNDKLAKGPGDTGNIIIRRGARLTAYAGIAGSSPSPVLAATAGIIDTTNAFFDRTVDLVNGNAPRAFLMGTDIVQPTYSTTQLTIASAGTVVAGGFVSGFESDSDKFTLQAVKTGTTTGVPLVFNVNGDLIEVVIRNAAVPTTLKITTTKNFGDGITSLGGIAVNGQGAVIINAPLSDFRGDILVAGSLASLAIHNIFGLQTRPALLRAGGTSSGATAIAGRRFSEILIDLPTVLSSWTLNDLRSSGNHNVISAERFGTITCTPNLAEGFLGEFEVDRVINLNRANSTLPAIGSVTVGRALGNTSRSSLWDIAGNIGSVTAALTVNWQLGAASGPNVRNGDKLHNVGVLNLGNVATANLHAVGKISTITATNWRGGDLQAGVFGSIKVAGNGALGNRGDFNGVTLTATSNSGLSTVTGVPSFAALSSLSVGGESANVAIHLLDGNATSIAVARLAELWKVTAEVTPHGGAIGKLTAGGFDNPIIEAKSAGTIAALGNASANLPGDFNGTILLHGTPGFTGVTLAALKVNGNLPDSNILVENGSVTSIAVGHSMGAVDIRAVGAAGAINSITAGEWIAPAAGSDNLVARNIGTLKITGAPMTAPGGFLTGNFTRVNVLTFLDAGILPAIGVLSVAGNYQFAINGFLRAYNGITTFKVGRAVIGGGAGTPTISLLNSSLVSDVPGRIASLTVGDWFDVDIAAKTLGAVKVVGFASPESPALGFQPGSFGGSHLTLFGATSAPLTPHVSLDSLTANDMAHLKLLAPFGITSLVAAPSSVATQQVTGLCEFATINTDNPPALTAGRIGTLQAFGLLGNHIRAVSIGTLRQTASTSLFDTTDVTVTGFTGPATAPVAIGAFAVAGRMNQSTVNVPDSITNFVVNDLGFAEIAAGFAANSGINTLSVGNMAKTNVTSRSIGIFSAAGVVSNCLVTLTGNRAGVALGSFIAGGKVDGATFNITGGNVTSFIVGAFSNSRLLVGFHPPAPGDIAIQPDPGNWLAGSTFTLGTFKTTGLFDPANIAATASFRDSFIVAQKLGTIAIAGLDPDVPRFSTSFRFGIASRGSGPTIKINGLDKPIGFTVGDFVYADLDG